MDCFLGLPWEAWTAIGTVVLALFTLLLFIATFGLFLITLLMRRDASKEAAIAHRNIERSLLVSQQSADAAVSGQRAFVFCEDVRFKQAPRVTSRNDEGVQIQPLEIEFDLRNEGHTPASVSEIFCVAKISADRDGPGDLPGSPFPRGNVIGAGKQLPLTDFLEVTLVDFKAAQNFQKHLFFYGLIGYSDFLKDPHVTRFCFKYDFHDEIWRMDIDPDWNDWD